MTWVYPGELDSPPAPRPRTAGPTAAETSTPGKALTALHAGLAARPPAELALLALFLSEIRPIVAEGFPAAAETLDGLALVVAEAAAESAVAAIQEALREAAGRQSSAEEPVGAFSAGGRR